MSTSRDDGKVCHKRVKCLQVRKLTRRPKTAHKMADANKRMGSKGYIVAKERRIEQPSRKDENKSKIMASTCNNNSNSTHTS